ncbi:putative ferric-chelate reductase 1 homolog [Wyeomyia smithii]|uniref:putative ferric-chelate reductase 1 homolog n=1 Tax=Wyeomyia smithii TaxID=174621 RepID=UPI002467B22D|nr:putative ferric-chelate reductase 1 homolog [Wyeomyia smithii]
MTKSERLFTLAAMDLAADLDLGLDLDLPDEAILIKLHGTFMVIAWLLFASLGDAVARYFKKTWVNERYFGGEAWFLYHRVYMFFTWLLTCSGFILIFIDMDGWQDNAHSVLGTIAFGLCFLQPIFGAMSPPGHPRQVARILHLISGHVAYYLAVINMFLAVGLKKSNLTEEFYGWFAGALAVHIFANVAYNVLAYMTRKKAAQQSEEADLTRDDSYSRWRKVTLLAQMIALLAITVAIVVLIWRA